MDYIRKTYGVPAKRGMHVTYAPNGFSAKHGVITGSRYGHLRVRVDGEKRSILMHPSWFITYHETAIAAAMRNHSEPVHNEPAGE